MIVGLFLLSLPQQVFLSEDFSSGVPPTGWTQLNNGNSAGWVTGSLNGSAAFHDDYTGFNDNTLLSPAMDLSSTTVAWFYCEQNVAYSSWRDHHYLEVSVDNGLTFIQVDDNTAGDGQSSIALDLSSWTGTNGVNLAFHYTGDYASEWTVDDVVVSDSSTPPPPAVIGTVVSPINGHTYHLLEASSWTDAEAAAVAMGGHLATVRSQAENDWIERTFGYWAIQNRDIWLGLNDVAVEGQYVWASGEPVLFWNWAVGQPDNNTGTDPSGEQYVHMYGTNSIYGAGQWNDMFDAANASWSPGYHGLVEIGGGGGGGPWMTVSNLTAGQTAQVDFTHCTPNNVVYFVWSVAGGGPINTAFGTGYVSPPYSVIPLPVNSNGEASLQRPVLGGLSGWPVWFHGADFGSGLMLNPLALTIG
ncbi:MAG: lectin-like protein [Planctomycetota bacterium]|jgi:hypothetical protein|nr:lectin-like protein [Planctomycetota bacterium]MDP6940972.1 lectin-like protein [Planctomycetota bacterium]